MSAHFGSSTLPTKPGNDRVSKRPARRHSVDDECILLRVARYSPVFRNHALGYSGTLLARLLENKCIRFPSTPRIGMAPQPKEAEAKMKVQEAV